MAVFSWLDQVRELSPANLTVFQANRLAENPLDLRYRAIFPRVPTASVLLSSIELTDVRFVGGRREWNAQPREIPEDLGPAREFAITPINYSHHIDEFKMQLLQEAGVQELVRRGIINSIQTWPTKLADACERQIERDAFEAWYTGIITVKDTKTSASVVVDLQFGTTEYPVAGTDWDDPGEDAYENFLAELQTAQNKMGSVGGARTHRTVVQAIVADAPDGPNGLRPTISSLQERVREEGFPNVNLIIDERTYDEFSDGGSATSAAYHVPDGLIAFQPADGRVGNTHFAPVTRAYDFLSGGGNRSDVNGIAVFRSEKNDGKTLMIEAQENALAMNEARRTYVVDTGIAR